MPYVSSGSRSKEPLRVSAHLYPINGACHRVAPDATAFADRDANFAPVIAGMWPDPEAPVFIGGDGEPSAMKALLASLAACDVDLIANRATLLGIEIDELSIEARGHFDIRRYLGLDAPDGPGYDRVACTVHLRTRGASADQLDQLRWACEEGSPVGDTLRRVVALTLEFDVT